LLASVQKKLAGKYSKIRFLRQEISLIFIQKRKHLKIW